MSDYKILVVDDIEINLNILCKSLSRHGFQIERALSGFEALEKLVDFQPDIVLLDINMPEMDGFECCEKIKELNKEVFVIFITALGDRVTRDKAYAVGGSDFLLKPLDIKLLLNKINSTLNVKSQIDSKAEEIKKIEEKSSNYEKTFIKFSNLKDLGSLTSTIAHDINNYLGGILGNLDLIELTNTNDEIAGYCNDIRKAVDNTADLTRQLTSYSKNQSEQDKAVDIQKVLDDVVTLIQRDVKYFVSVSKKYQQGNYTISGSKGQISTIFMNIIKNACEATTEEGQINVVLSQQELKNKKVAGKILIPGRYAVITIEDNGCGISHEMIEKIFEPFHTTKEKGTGLGLDSALKCIEKHKGGINIKSIVGEGTIVTVYLPLSLSKNVRKSATQRISKSDQIGLEGVKFLIIDDDEIFCKSISKFINVNGGGVTSFNDNRFTEFFSNEENLKNFDYLMIDYKIPFTDTFMVIEKMKDVNPELQTVIISGSFVDIADIEDCFFLRKPISFNRILDILKSSIKFKEF